MCELTSSPNYSTFIDNTAFWIFDTRANLLQLSKWPLCERKGNAPMIRKVVPCNLFPLAPNMKLSTKARNKFLKLNSTADNSSAVFWVLGSGFWVLGSGFWDRIQAVFVLKFKALLLHTAHTCRGTYVCRRSVRLVTYGGRRQGYFTVIA